MRRLYFAFIAILLGGFGLVASIGGETVRVASVSFVPEKFNLERNRLKLVSLFRDAAAQGAQLALAPEGILEGYVVNEIIAGEVAAERMREVALPTEGRVIRSFRDLAVELKMCLAFGFAELRGGDVYNAAIFIDDGGEISGLYHKMQLHEGYHPSWWFNRLGLESRAFETPYGRCGFLICNDRWNSSLARISREDGAQYLLIPAYGSRSEAQDEAVRARARENAVPVVEANVGLRMVVDAKGEILTHQRAWEGITITEIEIGERHAPRPGVRDRIEEEFKAWRKEEMKKRYQATQDRLKEAKNE